MNSDSPTPRLRAPAPLRIGLLIDSFTQRKWIHQVIEQIQSSGFAKVAVVIKNEAPSKPQQGRLASYWQNRNYLLYALYGKIDERRVKVKPDAFEPVDIKPLLGDTPVVPVTPVMKKYSDWFPEEVLAQIREFDLDVALCFGFRILKGEALKIAPHGVWSFHHGDNLVNRGGPAGFWEVMDGLPVTGSVLQILTEDLDNGEVIYRSWSPTADRFSVKANRNNLYWKSAAFVIRKLKDLAEGLPVRTESDFYQPYSNRLYRMPTNREMFSRLTRLGARYVASKFQAALNSDQWALAYRFRTGPADANNTLYRFKRLLPPKDRFWADPFAIKAGDHYYVFIEELPYETGKGHISVIEMDRKKGVVKGPTKVLERDYHLSYPFVFEWNGHYYMVPESAANKTVELYRAKTFPYVWQLEKVLMTDIRAKDATLAEVDGKWWMFVSTSEHSIPDELYLYSAKTPLGPWTPHARNPVKSDVRGSRPAGALFEWNGEVYRPAQDSSGRYGYAISINRLKQLDDEQFSEEHVSNILPNWDSDLLATHTISIAEDLTVVDCLVKRSRLF
ncbi:MAG TPA: hypothetical protein VFS77_21115 [Pyrinomonadaceae bacterium]|nr:hypothetical protein [Pyrinomonadaceae bacterium]